MIDRVTIPRAEPFKALEGGALVLTSNARLSRSQQRGIPRDAVELLAAYGAIDTSE